MDYRYYITGHRAYLDRYPDIIAKKNRGKKTRIPLWERATQLMKEETLNDTAQSSENPWWTDEWLNGLQNDNLGDYPIICRVERTHAEFPPDPYSKVVESDKKSDGTILRFKKPKKFVKSEGKVSMRLAITLRPLSHVMAPLSIDGCAATQNIALSVPPVFSVVSFPCELEPFLVPFIWGYIKSHSISLNQKFFLGNDKTNDVRVDAFVSLSGRDSMRIDDRQRDLEQFLSTDRNELEKTLGTQDITIPTREARVLLDLWYRRCGKVILKTDADNTHLKLSDQFRYLLQSTLPLWQSIFIRKRTYDVHKPRVSAWSLAPVGQGRDLTNAYFNWLDEPLRLKIERTLQGILSSDAEARELFFEPITEDIAPSYYCAVPLSMSFSSVMKRLRVNIGYKSCYYRSVETVLADISSILECCLLYNSPESDVVDIAANVVDNTKDVLTNAVRDHYKLEKSTRSKDCERPVVMLQPRLCFNNVGKKIGNHVINRDWLDVKLPTNSKIVDPNANADQLNKKEFPFQVGDVVVYSRNLHSRFITGHCSSLEYDQCHVPSTEHTIECSTLSDSTSDWEKGVIVSTHAVFPKILTRDEKDSFEVSAMLQCLGVKFGNENCPSALFWRPCLFNTDEGNSLSPCPGCGLTSSFMKLSPSECVGNKPPDHLIETTHKIQSINHCIDLLKCKCLGCTDPDKIETMLLPPNMIPANKAPITKIGKNSLPSYDKFLGFAPEQSSKDQLYHGTRGTILKPKDDDNAIAALLHAGFLPRWINASRGGTTDEDLLRKLDLILPVTKLSLEYISLKIKSGFYRHIAAIENDVVEAFMSTVYSFLFDAVTRKKAAISVRRISQLAAGEKIESSDIGVEEQGYVSQIHRIRSLYGTALLAVLDITRTQRVFGLSKSTPPKRSLSTPVEDTNHAVARQRLEHFVMVLRRENNNTSSTADERNAGMHHATLKIFFSNSDKTQQLVAKLGGALVKVNVVNRGQVLTNLGPRLQSERKETCQIITFGPADYEPNGELSRFLFARPGRYGPCARCQVHGRTMVACRVVRKHTNLDYDWLTLFNGGITFVDDLVKILDPDSLTGASERLNSKKDETQHEKIQLAHTASIVESVEVSDPDPSEFFQWATSALTQANELVDAANSYSLCPLRLSKKFIETSFPIDKSDGHFLYCVCCGLSGDLLCCDGCPNVVHARCISLINLPEGDWFCEKCVAKKSGVPITNTVNPDDSKFSHIYSYDENNSACFHESAIDTILSQLDKLKNSRQPLKTKENAFEITRNTAIGAVVATSKNEEISTITSKENKDVDHVAGITIKDVNGVVGTKNKKITDVANTENKEIESQQIIALPVPTRSIRTRSDGIMKDRPSIIKRRRIERSAV